MTTYPYSMDVTIDDADAELIDAFGTTLEAVTALSRSFDRSLRDAVDLPSTWFEALLRLHRTGEPMATGHLGEQLALTSGGATRLVDRLVEEGLVERLDCPTDRRVHHVGLTEEGRRVLAEALEVHTRDLHALFGDRVSATDRDHLIRILDPLRSPPEA